MSCGDRMKLKKVRKLIEACDGVLLKVQLTKYECDHVPITKEQAQDMLADERWIHKPPKKIYAYELQNFLYIGCS